MNNKTHSSVGGWGKWWWILAWCLCAVAQAAPIELHGRWSAVTDAAPPVPVAQVAATGGRYRFEAEFDIGQAGTYVVDFKNSSVVDAFTHQVQDAAGMQVVSLSGGIGSAVPNPFPLRHGREVTLDPGRYRLVTDIVSPFYLAHPAPYVQDVATYRQDIRRANAAVLVCLGVFLGLGVYYGTLALVRRQRVHAMYALFIVGNVLYNGTALLVANELFGRPWFYLISVPILFSNIAYVVFVMDLLDIRPATARRFHRAGQVVVGTMALFIVLSLVKPNWSLEFDRIGVAMFLVYGLAAGAVQALRGSVLARLYLLANVGFFFTGLSAITMFDLKGVFHVYIEHIGLFAVTIEVLLLALVLSYQFGMLHRDKADALHEARRNLALARTDALTGLPNRYALEKVLAQLPTEGSLTFVDLDGLKHYNDHFGHDRGDQLLQAFAKDFEERLDGLATLHRLGGDEFAATTADGRCELVEQKLQETIQALRVSGFELSGASSGSVRAFECAHPEQLKQVADSRMYEHKRRRRVRDQLPQDSGQA